MNKPFFDLKFLKKSEYPSNFIPSGAEVHTSIDFGDNEETVTCTAMCTSDGVIHIQDVKRYDSKGNEICL